MTGADLRAAARRRLAWLAFGSCAALCATAFPAAAQPADKPVSVANRPRPEYDPIGERLGALMIHPQVNVEVTHDDNIFATKGSEASDTFVRITPRVTVKTNWPRHSLSATAEGRFSRYDEFKSQDTDEWSATAAGRLDVTRDLNVNVNVGHQDKVEPRGSAIYLVTPLQPVTYTRDNASVSVNKTFNRLRVGGSVATSKYNYDDTRDVIGAILDQSYRDRQETEVRLRLAYAVSPMSAFFVEGGSFQHDYDRRSALGVARDSSSYSLLFGVEGELTRLVHGEASAGWAHYDFDNPAFRDVDNFNYKVQLEWYPTELLTVGLTGSQSLQDSPLPTTPGYIYRSLALTADYELRRNLILSGRLMAAKEDYQGVAGANGRRYGGSLAAKYLMSRGVGVAVRYDHEQRDTSGVSAAGFRDNTMGLSVTLER